MVCNDYWYVYVENKNADEVPRDAKDSATLNVERCEDQDKDKDNKLFVFPVNYEVVRRIGPRSMR